MTLSEFKMNLLLLGIPAKHEEYYLLPNVVFIVINTITTGVVVYDDMNNYYLINETTNYEKALEVIVERLNDHR